MCISELAAVLRRSEGCLSYHIYTRLQIHLLLITAMVQLTKSSKAMAMFQLAKKDIN
jgi:quinol monooxygenase YgiN